MITTLKIDIDEPLDSCGIEAMEKRVALVAANVGVELELQQLWRTTRGCHVVVSALAELSPGEVVTLQLLLGSDWKREMFNFARVLILADAPTFWHNRWNVLYSEKLRGEPE